MSYRRAFKARPSGVSYTMGRARAARYGTSSAGRARLNAMRGRMAPVYTPLNRRAVASKDTGFVDLASGAYAFDTTGTIVLLATVAQGASVNQRIGKKAMWKSLQCRGTLNSGTTTTIADGAFLVVYDRRPTGSLPAITDILVTANSTSFNNDANSGRFQILKRVDFVHTGNSTTPATGGECIDGSFFLDLKNKPVVFKAAGTGAIGDIEEGALYFVSVGATVPGTAASVGTLAFRTRFQDV